MTNQPDSPTLLSTQLITGSKQVALVNKTGQQIGTADVFAAHRYPPQLHAASSVWLWRSSTNPATTIEVLFQQRSQFKPIGAGWWGNTVCGNIKPDESYQSCAERRLQAEMSIDPTNVTLHPLYTFTYKTYGNESYGEYEFDQMYTAQFNDDSASFYPNPDEVMNTAWLPIHQLIDWATQLNFPSIESTLTSTWDELKIITSPHTFTYASQNYTIAPWVLLMLRDPRLATFFGSQATSLPRPG